VQGLELLLGTSGVARILNGITCRDSGQAQRAQINADRFIRGGQPGCEPNLDGEDNVKGASFTLDRARLDGALDPTRQLDFDRAKLGEMKPVTRQLPARAIRIAEGGIAVPTLEPWVSRCLARLDPTKERFHGFVQAQQDILQDMAADLLLLWPDALLDLDEIAFLLVAASGLPRLRVGFPSLLQRSVVQLAAARKHPFQLLFSGLLHREGVREGFEHAFVLLSVSWHTGAGSRPLPD
jgi:hypothetical protein